MKFLAVIQQLSIYTIQSGGGRYDIGRIEASRQIIINNNTVTLVAVYGLRDLPKHWDDDYGGHKEFGHNHEPGG
jgi:hypothetical protein